jgi:UPF0176 protein
MDILNVAFYQFAELSRLEGGLIPFRDDLRARTAALNLRGSILVSLEGVNCMVAGSEASVREFIAELESRPYFKKFEVKESWSSERPFTRMLVKIKKEIIPMGKAEIKPAEHTGKRLTALELKKWLDEGKEVVLLDTRNEYEIDLGTFRNARRMGLNHFREFSERLQEFKSEIKDKPVVMFCTGGIRCEKAAALALNEDFSNVYQLDGGILKYFEDCGAAHYDGSCFVFDQRVALQPDLSPAPINHPVDTRRRFMPRGYLKELLGSGKKSV